MEERKCVSKKGMMKTKKKKWMTSYWPSLSKSTSWANFEASSCDILAPFDIYELRNRTKKEKKGYHGDNQVFNWDITILIGVEIEKSLGNEYETSDGGWYPI